MTDDNAVSRRRALICLSGLIAAPFVIRHPSVLMPTKSRLALAKTMPTVQQVRAWRESMRRLVERRTVSWTGEGMAEIIRMGRAEDHYKAMGLL